jgi:hypothetical protein
MRLLLSICALVLAARPALAGAADSDARLRDALRSTTAQLRALEDEKAGWQAKESQWKAREARHDKQVEALRAELETARSGAARATDEKSLKERVAEQERAVASSAAALVQCQKEAQDRASELAAVERKSTEQQAEITGRVDGLSNRVAACEAKNARIVAASKEFMRWVAGEDDQLCNPLLQLRRVELENRAQSFEDQLLDNKVGQMETRARQ